MKKVLILALLLICLPALAGATSLKVGVSSGVNSMDPQFHNETPTNSVNSNLFDGLVNFDKDLNPYPALAESWEVLDDVTWRFTLRQGVTFHNGNAFDADDVIWSFNRAKTSDKSGFKGALSAIQSMEKVDDYTVDVTTNGPFPILLAKLTYLKIMDKEYAEPMSDEDLGRKPVGTGPYTLLSWQRGQSIVLEANPDYFLGMPSIERVEIRPLTNDSTRVAAILSNAVGLINQVPVRDVDRIKAISQLRFVMQPGLRLIYLQMDQHREQSPYVEGVESNPFLDVRVRKALYHGIDEDAIVEHIMGGFAVPAGQYYPAAVTGYDPNVTRPPYDPDKARQLLKEAGYEDGFTVTLDTPNDRYINDDKIAQAVASSLAKIGINVKVNAIPKGSFFPKANDADSSFNLIGWACSDGDGSAYLDANAHTYDPERGYGRYNGGRYSNPEVDAIIQESSTVLEPEKREALLIEATHKALLEDQNIIPLHFQVNMYAMEDNLKMSPRADGYLYFFDMEFE
jgi:peptide/nickel transport system substrate-binding protein